MVLSVETPHGELVFVPENLNDSKLVWRCIPGEGLKRATLPPACRDEASAPPR